MAVKVSVVVPVYNPGSHIDELIASLLRQSLPHDEFEAVFVDDGSTDGTGERLDALAREHVNFRVVHIPNSGWAGRPRNVGIESARGRYVYFVDNDDWIGDEALERLYTMAERNGSDIVIGKTAGHGRRVPMELFSTSRDRVTLESYPPLTSTAVAGDPLTPHKLFRREFLDEHGIRFPEGRRRLEDHVFVMNAYVRAEVISVLADYVCYHWVSRADDTNAARARIDPRGYFENGREVIDIVDHHTEAGPLRDRVLRDWYQGKMLRRLGGAGLLAYSPEYREALFDEMRRLALERFGAGVVRGLPVYLRMRSALLHAGDLERLIALARIESAIKPGVRLEEVRWDSGLLRFSVSGRLTYGDGTPLAFTRDGERLYWDPPLELGPEVTLPDRDVTSELETSRIDVVVRSRKEGAEFLLPTESTTVRHEDGGSIHVAIVTEARLDPLTAGAGKPLARGVWDVVARVRTGGWARPAKLDSHRSARAVTLRPAVVGDPLRVVIPFSTRRGKLSIEIDHSSRRLFAAVAPDEARVALRESGVAFALAVPLVWTSTASSALAEFHAESLGGAVGKVTLPATFTPADLNDLARLEAVLPFATFPTPGFVSPGSWKLSATIGPSTKPLGFVLDIADDGAVSLRTTRSYKRRVQRGELRRDAVNGTKPGRTWRRHVPRLVRVGARAALRRSQRLRGPRVRVRPRNR